jgi:hypothetical protein
MISAGGAIVDAGEGLVKTAVGRGRTEGEATTGGVEIAGAISRAVAAGLGDAGMGGAGVVIATGVARTVGTVVAAGLGVARAGGASAGVAAEVPAGAAAGVAMVGAVLGGAGFTNVFGGASRGGATSAFIFSRARSAAARSVSGAQLFSTEVWAIVSLTVCGRSTPLTLVIAGADITRTSPRTVGKAVVSELIWRSRRYRSIGCRLRERISSKFGPWLTTVVFAKVMLVTLVVSITMVILRSTGTTDWRMRREPNSFSGTNEYWSGPIS